MINEEVFRSELDQSLKKQGFKKKERTGLINDYILNHTCDRWDYILEREAKVAREVTEQKKLDNHIPSEFKEQCDFVAWFKASYPDMVIMSNRNHGTRSQAEKVEQIMEGLHAGVADLLIPELHLWIEFKRQKGGVLSDAQKTFRDYVTNDRVKDSWMLAEGFRDGQSKLIKFLESRQ